jgi:hypothetical protein
MNNNGYYFDGETGILNWNGYDYTESDFTLIDENSDQALIDSWGIGSSISVDKDPMAQKSYITKSMMMVLDQGIVFPSAGAPEVYTISSVETYLKFAEAIVKGYRELINSIEKENASLEVTQDDLSQYEAEKAQHQVALGNLDPNDSEYQANLDMLNQYIADCDELIQECTEKIERINLGLKELEERADSEKPENFSSISSIETFLKLAEAVRFPRREDKLFVPLMEEFTEISNFDRVMDKGVVESGNWSSISKLIKQVKAIALQEEDSEDYAGLLLDVLMDRGLVLSQINESEVMVSSIESYLKYYEMNTRSTK